MRGGGKTHINLRMDFTKKEIRCFVILLFRSIYPFPDEQIPVRNLRNHSTLYH